ncbi:RNA-guided endonuclease InsQ/TnpB family protein [Eubacterium sp.]|uniref:RNA-guided endonuclease InsQ/TnpB family protein n=1 Tax=Eubacterium sp. TaxID=142586 RepID=UPI002E9C4B62|nr:transposase [Eubacterium sp.]
MLKSFKTEINPTPEQKNKINRTIGTCRFVYNFYIAHNKEIYGAEKKFMSGMDFQKWLNNTWLKEHPEYLWIKKVSSKSVKQSIMNADRAFKSFFKKKSSFPKFKKKNRSDVKMYFVKNNQKECFCERHRINIPTLGWIRLKEKGYIPTTKQGYVIKSGTVSQKAGRYYVSVLLDMPESERLQLNDFGLGIDLGVKDFAIVSNGETYKNINKTAGLRKLEKQLKREQRCLSRRYEDLKKRNKIRKGEATRQNIQKQVLKVQKIYRRISNIHTDYINKTIAEIVKNKPSYITIEDLNVKGMMKNRHLSKAVASQKFYEFRIKLEAKCRESGIELRVVDRWYPSSKLCHHCGSIRRDLKLSDRIYKCSCGYTEDRDFNAALNLRDALTYEIA